MIPAFIALDRSVSFKSAFRKGLFLSFWFGMFCFYWIYGVLVEYGGLPSYVAGILALLFNFISEPQWYVMAPLIWWIQAQRERIPGYLRGLTIAFLFAATDSFAPKLFRDTLGHGLYASERLRQCADLFGAHGLTFCIVWVNWVLYEAFRAVRQRDEPSIWPTLAKKTPYLASSLLLFLTLYGYGSMRLGQVKSWMSEPQSSVPMAAIQGNIGDIEKLAAEQGFGQAAVNVLNTMMTLSEKAMQGPIKPEVLVWPETTYPSNFRKPTHPVEQARDSHLERFVKRIGVPVVFGGYDQIGHQPFNSMFFLAPDGALATYHKNILLMFGEYIPGMSSIPWLMQLLPQIGNFGRGSGPAAIEIPLSQAGNRSVKAGPIICYEALFPYYTIEEARLGAQFLLNATNDSWFGNTSEPHLHISLSAFRSIETKLPQLRSTNTGISALILPDGSINLPTKIYEPGIMSAPVPIYKPFPHPVLMLLWGDWFPLFGFLMGIAGLCGCAYFLKRRPV